MAKKSCSNYEIIYEGKGQKENILKRTPPTKLQTVKTYGRPDVGLFNCLIYGDNLPVLKTLLETPEIAGKVRLVYIDPPFATNQTFCGKKLQLAYRDQLSGAAYLEFIRKRLILIRKLLAKDGSVYVHLDSNMAFEIKLIMDEVFGPSNFRNWISRKKSNRKNYTRKSYGNIQDFILFYTKSDKYVWNRPYKKRGRYSFKERFPKIEKETGKRYALVPIHAPGIRNGTTGREWRGMNPPEGKHWMYTPNKLDEFDRKGEIYWSSTGNPRRKIYADNDKGVPIQDIWLEFKDAHNQNVAVTGYPTEKNIDLLKRIIEASSNEGDIVLDSFAGSGTTLAAATELNRKWIGIDNSKLAVYVTLKRLIESRQLPLQPTQNPVNMFFNVMASQNDPMMDNNNHEPNANIILSKEGGHLTIEIENFSSNDSAAKKQKRNGFNLLGMVAVDSNYNGSIFNIEKAISGEQIQKDRKIGVEPTKKGVNLGVSIYDIYGNEVIVSKNI